MIVTRAQSNAWLQPLVDELGINLMAVMDVQLTPDKIMITCVASPEPDAEWPPAVMANQPAADEFAPLLYRVEAQIVDPEPAS